MSKNCMITFDQNEHGTYFTGQVITGKVHINFNKSKKLKGIKLEICGYAYAQWRDKHGTPEMLKSNARPGRKGNYFGREDYVASTTYLFGSEQSQNTTIESGSYTYTFSCAIPQNCPSSFEGSFGHIRYIAKVSFLRAGASNRTHNVGFTVLKLLDLNHESKLLQQPASNEATEYFCFMNNKPVQLKVNIAQTGYVPGQFMLINAHVRNDSSSDCKKLIIMLYLRANYMADQPSIRTASEKILLLKKECGPVTHYTEKSYAETMRIPATAPTCEHLSRVVRVSYEVHVEVVMNWLMANPRAMIPITIGNVPLATMAMPATSTVTATNCPLPMPNELPTTSMRAMELAQNGYSEDELDDYELPEDADDELEIVDEIVNELPPPTYEQAMFMSTDIADTDVNTVSEASQFAPRYPVFDVDTFQSPPPNPPQKRRRRRRRRTTEKYQEKDKEKLTQSQTDSQQSYVEEGATYVESRVQI